MKKLGWACALVLSTGCPDEGGGSTKSNVKRSLVISELSTDEVERVCRAQVEYRWSRGSLENNCTVDAVFETEDLPACVEWVELCVKEEEKDRAKRKRERLDACARSELHCDFTVGEYEDCYRDDAKEWEEIANSYSCREAGDYQDVEYPDNYGSEACQRVLGSCYNQ